jgi:hypothetical protein
MASKNIIHLSLFQPGRPNIGLSTHFALRGPLYFLHHATSRYIDFNHRFTWNRDMTTWPERYAITCHTIDYSEEHLILRPQKNSSPYGQRDL